MTATAPNTPVIREITCRTVLNRCAIGDYSLNCYVGCAHGCVYCYARFMQRFHPHAEPWGGFVDVKVNAVDALRRQLPRTPPGAVFMSSACDGWQPLEQERGLTRECCRLLLDCGFRVNVLTKSVLVLRDLDIFAGRNAQVGVTITTLDDGLKALWEPRAGSIEERFRVLEQAKAAGLDTAVMFGPLLPFLSDTPPFIEAMLQRARDLDVDAILFDALNPRPKVWESVSGLLRQEFPDLAERYRRVLYAPRVREAYLQGLRERIADAVQRFHLTGRVTTCM